MSYGSFSPPDPFLLNPNTVFPVTYNYDGKTLVDPRLVPGENTIVVIPFGDSLATCSENAAYLPSSNRVHNLSLQNGGMYNITTPIVGCTNNTNPAISGQWSIRLGDKMIADATVARLITMPIGVGGTQTSDWAASGSLNSRMGVAFRRLQYMGLTAADVVWLCSLGANDQALAVPSATVRANLNSVVSSIRGFGSTHRILMAKSSYAFGSDGGANGTAVLNGILNSISDNAANKVYAGADYNSVTGVGNRYDGTHFTATGSDTVAGLWKSAIAAATP